MTQYIKPEILFVGAAGSVVLGDSTDPVVGKPDPGFCIFAEDDKAYWDEPGW